MPERLQGRRLAGGEGAAGLDAHPAHHHVPEKQASPGRGRSNRDAALDGLAGRFQHTFGGVLGNLATLAATSWFARPRHRWRPRLLWPPSSGRPGSPLSTAFCVLPLMLGFFLLLGHNSACSRSSRCWRAAARFSLSLVLLDLVSLGQRGLHFSDNGLNLVLAQRLFDGRQKFALLVARMLAEKFL